MADGKGAVEDLVSAGFWRGTRVFLTGHTGFKGSWLSLWLRELGAEVTGYALAPPTRPSLFEAARVAEGMTSIVGDVRDLGALAAALAKARPTVVVHMAAQPILLNSYAEPVETFVTNLLGTVHVLEAVRRAGGVRALVHVSSDKCYENRGEGRACREDDPLGGADPYSSSKACAELAVEAYRRSFFAAGEGGVALASARAGNAIGGGDWSPRRLLPDLLRALDGDATLKLRHPEATRPWQHVLEPLAGYLMLARKLCEEGQAFAGAWNFGPDAAEEIAVQSLVERLVALSGRPLRWRREEAATLHEAPRLRLDSTKARERLGWRPRWDLDRALRAVLEWHDAFARGCDMRAVTLGQIASYAGAGVARP